MNDDRQNQEEDRSWLERLKDVFSSEPENQEDLLEILETAKKNHIIDQDVLRIIDGAMHVAGTQACDIMVTRSKMVYVQVNQTLEELLPIIIETAHSRYPVIGESTDDVIGLLLAKDLLPYILKSQTDFDLRQLLRPITFVPESKRLNILLREFREKFMHMAVVIDEYGGVAGLITLEDILEEIVGEIEDEYDEAIMFIEHITGDDYRISGLTPIETINEKFGTTISDEEYDTIGGIIIQTLGQLPKIGEVIEIENLRFRVLEVDNRQLHWLRVSPAMPNKIPT
jgi:magnesium and cobalt transporter